jgi:hypothetical protein
MKTKLAEAFSGEPQLPVKSEEELRTRSNTYLAIRA